MPPLKPKLIFRWEMKDRYGERIAPGLTRAGGSEGVVVMRGLPSMVSVSITTSGGRHRLAPTDANPPGASNPRALTGQGRGKIAHTACPCSGRMKIKQGEKRK